MEKNRGRTGPGAQQGPVCGRSLRASIRVPSCPGIGILSLGLVTSQEVWRWGCALGHSENISGPDYNRGGRPGTGVVPGSEVKVSSEGREF
jgi:hypothetical protein